MSKDNAVAVREESRALTPAQARTERIREAMVERLPAILPNGMKPERFEAVTLQAIAKNPDLANADPTSIVLAVLEAAQLGLEPTGSLSRAWLVTYGKQAQLMIGYQGLVDLARRSGEVSKVSSRVVYEGDDFAVTYGTTEGIHHIPMLETSDPTKITHVYAIATLRTGDTVFDVMTKAQVDAIRARSRSGNKGPWVSDFGEMARKTVVRRLVKSLPLTAEAIEAIERDTEREYANVEHEATGSRTATVKDAIRARLTAGTPVDAPGPDENPDPGTSAPAASADQQTAQPEPTQPETQVTEVCGATSDPELGDVETCVLTPGHAFPDGKLNAHQSAGGSKFPRKAGEK